MTAADRLDLRNWVHRLDAMTASDISTELAAARPDGPRRPRKPLAHGVTRKPRKPDERRTQEVQDAHFESLHPRGVDGRFIEKGGDVYVTDREGNNERGKVLSVDRNGAVIQFADGSTKHISVAELAKRVSQAPKAKARLGRKKRKSGGGGSGGSGGSKRKTGKGSGGGGGSGKTPAEKIAAARAAVAERKRREDRQDKQRDANNTRQDKNRRENWARQDKIRAENRRRDEQRRAKRDAERAIKEKQRAVERQAKDKERAAEKRQQDVKKSAVNQAETSYENAQAAEEKAIEEVKRQQDAVGRASEANQRTDAMDTSEWNRTQDSLNEENAKLEAAKTRLKQATDERIKRAMLVRRARRASVVGGALVAVAWDEWKHPRGRDGKFIEKGGIVNVLAKAGGGPMKRGQVTDLTPSGPDVKYSDGSTEHIPLADVTKRLTAAPKSRAEISGRDDSTSRKGLGDIALDPRTVAEMRADPRSTAAMHLVDNPDGTTSFSPERQALHDEIIRKHTAGKTAPSGKPAFNVMGGGPAAGKSNMVENAGIAELTDKSAVMVNADEMKDELPEYKQMLRDKDAQAASLAHEESSYLAKRLQAASFEHGLNVTLDGTGDSSTAKMQSKLKEAKDAGYTVNGFYTTVPTDVAVDRAYIRGEKIGRHVPESVIRGTHVSVSQVFPDIFKDFDNAQLFQTEGDLKPIMSWDGKKMTMSDQGLYDTFVAKGKESTGAKGPSPAAVAKARLDAASRAKAATPTGLTVAPTATPVPTPAAPVPTPAAGMTAAMAVNRQKLSNVARIFGIHSKQYTAAKTRLKV